jgi:hypothetical protein
LSLAYFFLVLGLIACVLASRREIEAKPMRLSHLYGAVLAAALLALAAFLLVPLTPGGLVVWCLALAVGTAIGVMRGVMMRIQVDQMWALIRLPQAQCGRLAVSLIGLLVVALIASRIAGPAGTDYLQPLGAALAWCAGFLGGRALAIAGRVRRAPHFELRQF